MRTGFEILALSNRSIYVDLSNSICLLSGGLFLSFAMRLSYSPPPCSLRCSPFNLYNFLFFNTCKNQQGMGPQACYLATLGFGEAKLQPRIGNQQREMPSVRTGKGVQILGCYCHLLFRVVHLELSLHTYICFKFSVMGWAQMIPGERNIPHALEVP